MVMKPTGMTTATGDPAGTGGSAPAAEPSKVNASSPGSAKSKIKKRKVRAKRPKTAAAAAAPAEVASVGAGTAGGDAFALVPKPEPANITIASPVVQAPKPATDGEGPMPTPVPATDDEGPLPTPVPANGNASASAAEQSPVDTNPKASASAAKQNPADTDAKASAPAAKQDPADTDADAAAASSKGKGVAANSSGGDRKMNRKQSAKDRVMKGKGKQMDDGGRKRKGFKAVVDKGEKGGNKAAGFIFMCNQQTKPECYQSRLFGLPSGKFEMVKKIKPGAKLFLYDFDLKLLYGVYKAASCGGMDLVREAFNGKFPAQVKFDIDRDCLPLCESSFKHAIKENYSASSKFHPELSWKQVQRLIALFKPANVPHSVPNKRLDERRRNREQRQPRLNESHRNRERRQPYHFEERRRSMAIEEMHQPRFDERRHPAALHVPVEDTYRAPRFAPLPVESRLAHSLANVRDEHHTYYEPVHRAAEPRHIPLSIDSRHDPLVLERQHLRSLPEPRHVPSASYRTLAPSDDSYYQPVADLGPERFADRTMAERTARDPIITRDYRTPPVELSAHPDRVKLYGTGGTRVAHVEEHYSPRELALGADRVGIYPRADRLEDLYRPEQLDARAVDFPRRSTYTDSAYAETSQIYYPAMSSASGRPVSSVYSYSGGPVYR